VTAFTSKYVQSILGYLVGGVPTFNQVGAGPVLPSSDNIASLPAGMLGYIPTPAVASGVAGILIMVNQTVKNASNF
jgi:hypothetical protein